MVTVGTLVFVVIVALVVGGIAGAVAFPFLTKNTWAADRRHSRELQQRLTEAEQKYAAYQQEVTEHFAETARRVNNLTRQYRDVHEYLATSASKLTTPAISRDMLEATQGKLAIGNGRTHADSSAAKQTDSPAPEAVADTGRGERVAELERES